MNNELLKERAQAQIKDYALILAGIYAICAIMQSIGGIACGVGMLFTFGFGQLAIAHVALKLAHGTEPVIEDVKVGFDNWKDTMFLGLYVAGYTALWSLLLIVPGFIKWLSYSMSFFIKLENPGMAPVEAFERSQQMMEGRKMELFNLLLSMIGWILLGLVTCGLGFLYVGPYLYAVLANYYNEIKNQPFITPAQ